LRQKTLACREFSGGLLRAGDRSGPL
jgi:hypothetical protein